MTEIQGRYDLPVSGQGLPDWLEPMLRVADSALADDLSRFAPPEEGGRDSAVLILFGPAADSDIPGDVLIIQRAATLNSHPGQPAFPGGAADPGDGGPVGTAIREAVEETGLDPDGVQPFGVLPQLFLPVSSFVVTPVLAWWRQPSAVRAVDQGEVASVHRIPLAHLLDPTNRVHVKHPSGYVGPAFIVDGLVIWGFTAGLLSRLLELAGWEQAWDHNVFVELPEVGS